ncbi:MAG: SDR family NAD(P)-dependent oxidoreductase [Caldilineaceae bacterium]|nr:SDR family NAD(P)-dependent oxidoreductase [Caldilineaceae bacterium]
MRTILITGATDGIGLALSQLYAQRGERLVLVGRRPLEELDRRLFTLATYCRVDLSHPDCAEAIAAWLDARGIAALDLVIHNAGLGYVGAIAAQPEDNLRALVDVNLWAPITLTHRLYERVRAAQGRFVFISSVAAAIPAPDYAIYSATKAALDGFVHNWRTELRAAQSGVTAQLIHLGATRTNMHAKSGADPAALGWERFPPPAEIARKIAKTIAGPAAPATIGLGNRLVYWTGRKVPQLMDRLAPRRQLSGSARPRPAGQAHCVITGAAGGIGRALMFAFADAGYAVTGIDRDAARAAQTQAELVDMGRPAQMLVADLTNAGDLQRLASELAALPPADVLVHNAGISCVGPFVHSPIRQQRSVVEVNLLAPLALTANLLRQGGLAAGGTVVCVSSLSHFVGYPGAAVYAATKDGLAAYARSLRIALSSQGGRVLTVYPGPTRTAHARRYSPDNRREQRRMAPDRLAGQILAAVVRRRRILIPGMANQLSAALGYAAPTLMQALMRRALYEPLARLTETRE